MSDDASSREQEIRNATNQAGIDADTLRAMTANIRTQYNAGTADPMFVVFEKQLIAGVGDGFAEDWMWVTADDGEHSEADHEMAVILDRLRDDGEPLVIGRRTYEKLGIKRVDKFCAAFLTRKGAEDYLASNGHNLKQPFIYVHGMYRNAEMIAVRNFFLTRVVPA